MIIKELKDGAKLSIGETVNLEVQFVSLKKDEKNKLGRHPDEEEAYIILSGEAMLLLGEEQQKVKKGQLVYVPANTVHQFTSLADDFAYVYAATWPEELKGRK